ADALDFFLLLGRKVERVAQKDIPVPLIAGIVGHNRLESLGESNFLHRQKMRVSNALFKINDKTGRATGRQHSNLVMSATADSSCGELSEAKHLSSILFGKIDPKWIQGSSPATARSE